GRLDSRFGRTDAALAQFAEARSFAEQCELGAEIAEIDARIVECQVIAGRGPDTLDTLDALLAALRPETATLRAQLLRLRGCALAQAGAPELAAAVLDEAREAAVAAEQPHEEAAALTAILDLGRVTAIDAAAHRERRAALYASLGVAFPRLPVHPVATDVNLLADYLDEPATA